jgi:Tfp pilus assembly protein PilO
MSTVLVSDSKSAIEGVRWILIRRAVLGILFMAMVTLGTIRYATYLAQERQKEEERRKADEEELRRDAGRTDHTSAADAAVILTAT